jgi:hypothetical protein
MKHGLFYTIGIIVLSMVSVTTSTAQVQMQPTVGVPSAPGPYDATPSWDQKLPSTSRFIILSDSDNAAVLDKETGLVWQRSPNNTATSIHNACSYCTMLYLSNRLGWRLPSIHELGTLVDPSVASGPKLPSGHPFTNVQSSNYWSASYLSGVPSDKYANLVWFANFNQGRLGTIDITNTNPSYYFWCVRGGQGVSSIF